MTIVKSSITTEKVTDVIISSTMDKTSFVLWLSDELKEREWSPSELARRSGISQSAISLVMNGERNPGTSLCKGIAKAFKIPPETVYRMAGLLSVKPNDDETVTEITHIYHELNEDNRTDLLDYARLRLQKQEKSDKHRRPPSRPSSS